MARVRYPRNQFRGRSYLKASGKPRESGIVKEAIYALRKLGFTAWRNANLATPVIYEKNFNGGFHSVYRKNPLAMKGVADIIAIAREPKEKAGAYINGKHYEANELVLVNTQTGEKHFPRKYFGTFYLEAKAEDGTQSDAQKDFEAIVEAGGEAYILFHSLDELMQKLKARGIL